MFVPLGIFFKTDFVRYFDYSEALGDLVNNPVSMFSLSEFLFATLPNAVKDTIDTQSLNHIFDKDEVGKGILFIVWCILLGINVFYPRFYCKYLCPYAAMAALFSENSLLKLQIDDARCVGRKNCGICEKVCPMQIRILDESSSGFTGEGECILCLECLEKCPYNAIRFKFGI
jgi:polyferredoxin